MTERSTDKAPDPTGLERNINRLAVERGALFDKAGATLGLSAVDQLRLKGIESELDECFLHTVICRIGPLRRVQRERGPVLIQEPPQQLGVDRTIHAWFTGPGVRQ